jgi:hypothetical protein
VHNLLDYLVLLQTIGLHHFDNMEEKNGVAFVWAGLFMTFRCRDSKLVWVGMTF